MEEMPGMKTAITTGVTEERKKCHLLTLLQSIDPIRKNTTPDNPATGSEDSDAGKAAAAMNATMISVILSLYRRTTRRKNTQLSVR